MRNELCRRERGGEGGITEVRRRGGRGGLRAKFYLSPILLWIKVCVCVIRVHFVHFPTETRRFAKFTNFFARRPGERRGGEKGGF